MTFRTLVKKLIPSELFHKIEPLGHLIEAIIFQVKYGFPAKNLNIIGVTGTDGKTSTTTLITQMLRTNGYKVAMMSTISIDYGDGRGPQPNPSRLTTLGASDLVRSIKKIRSLGIDWLVLETTSQALAQYRVWGIPYKLAVMTNINHEHLDYHRTFEKYRSAKLRLFKQCNANRKGLRTGVINADDKSAELFSRVIANPITYGIKSGDIKATNINLKPDGVTYTAKIESDKYQITCHLPGSYNIYNSLAAVTVGRAIGLKKDQIESGIEKLTSVEGRMTSINEGQNFGVIVDYAHTPESFEKVFNEVRPITKKRLIVVFGSAGRRDEEKRSRQGSIAGTMCDVVVVTEEDDRDEDGFVILDQIASGAIESGKVLDKDLFLVHEREEAIETALDIAEPDDMVLLLGKGHEKSILSNGPQAEELRHLQQDDTDKRRVKKRSYDEIQVAHELLKKRVKY